VFGKYPEYQLNTNEFWRFSSKSCGVLLSACDSRGVSYTQRVGNVLVEHRLRGGATAGDRNRDRPEPTGLALAIPVAASTVTVTDPGRVGELFTWVVMPLFLFSGTFFAVDQMPPALRSIATLGTATWARSIVHIGYLLACVLIGLWHARRTSARNLHA
jgi:hypothetical protein